MSTGTERGWLSNNNGKPTTAPSTSTAEPISRISARLRMASTLSVGPGVRTLSFCLPNLNQAMKPLEW